MMIGSGRRLSPLYTDSVVLVSSPPNLLIVRACHARDTAYTTYADPGTGGLDAPIASRGAKMINTRLGDSDLLLVIDVQNDFCAGGALAVTDGDAVVPIINRLAE